MVDKSDLNKIKEKLNIGGIVDSLKSMINPAGGIPTVDPSDALGLKIAEICTLLKQTTEAQNQQVESLNKVNSLLNVVFKDIEALRAKTKSSCEKKPDESTCSSTESKKTEHKEKKE